MRYSAAIIATRHGPHIPELLTPMFTENLGGVPDSFSWEFVPEGGVWNHTREGTPMLADEDLVKLAAYKERSITKWRRA